LTHRVEVTPEGLLDNDATTRGIERYLDGHFRIASTLSEALANVAVAAA